MKIKDMEKEAKQGTQHAIKQVTEAKQGTHQFSRALVVRVAVALVDAARRLLCAAILIRRPIGIRHVEARYSTMQSITRQDKV